MVNDPRIAVVAIERRKAYDRYIDLQWAGEESDAAYATYLYWDKLKQEGVEYVPKF